MFEAKLDEAALLKKIVESIKDLTTDVNFDTSGTGISMQAMDASHVALVSLNMGMDLFEDYRCDVPIQLGVSMTTLSKILKLANSEDSLILSATEDPNNLTMRFESKDEKKSVNFKINLLNIDAEHLGIPDTQYAATVTMNSNEFAKNIHDLYSLADTVQIEAESGHVKMSIEGDMGQGEIELIENNSTNVQADAPVKLSFSLRYLNMFTKAASLSPQVTLCLLPDTPLVISYDLKNHGSLKFYLAPKIND